MTRPTFDPLPPDLLEIQKRWLELPRREQDDLYAREFAARFVSIFAGRQLVGAPDHASRPRVLISLLGFSWQPIVLMAAWCRPERMFLIGTGDSLALEPAGENILSLIARLADIPQAAIETARVGDPGEEEIYRHVREFVERSDVPPREVFIDPTGGKKSMSAAAALAGYVLGVPLVYVDYAQYHGPHRIPVAGTEYLRLLVNPLEELGELERRDIFRAFDRSDFAEAGRLAERLAAHLYEPRGAECLATLSRGYDAWDRFRFAQARTSLLEARDLLERFGERGGWNWTPRVREVLAGNLRALEALARTEEKPARMEDGTPLLAWYLAAAGRLLEAGKISLSVLLVYAAIERFIGLCLWIDFGLDPGAPDYGKIDGKLDRNAYHAAGKQLVGRAYEPHEPSGLLMFTNGAQLLAALSPARLKRGDLGHLAGLANARNRCEYEHGFLPRIPSREEAARFLSKARGIVARVFENPETLDAWLGDCRFPGLEVV